MILYGRNLSPVSSSKWPTPGCWSPATRAWRQWWNVAWGWSQSPRPGRWR